VTALVLWILVAVGSDGMSPGAACRSQDDAVDALPAASGAIAWQAQLGRPGGMRAEVWPCKIRIQAGAVRAPSRTRL
jgi:hypothetical protein